jgi:hypothetical protein
VPLVSVSQRKDAKKWHAFLSGNSKQTEQMQSVVYRKTLLKRPVLFTPKCAQIVGVHRNPNQIYAAHNTARIHTAIELPSCGSIFDVGLSRKAPAAASQRSDLTLIAAKSCVCAVSRAVLGLPMALAYHADSLPRCAVEIPRKKPGVNPRLFRLKMHARVCHSRHAIATASASTPVK